MQTIEEKAMSTIHTMVWRFREEFNKYFPTPIPLKALWFAEEEMGEARRAAIRLDGTKWNRNNQEKTTEEDRVKELAQALMMVVSADPNRVPHFYLRSDSTISHATEMVASASQVATSMPGLCHAYMDSAASELYVLIDQYADPVVAVMKVLREIYVKRIQPQYAVDLLKEIKMTTTDHKAYHLAVSVEYLMAADGFLLMREKK